MANFMIRFLICNVFISGIIGILLIAKRIFKNNLSSRMQYNLWFLLLGLLAVPFIPFRLIGFPQIFSWLGSLRSSPASGTATNVIKITRKVIQDIIFLYNKSGCMIQFLYFITLQIDRCFHLSKLSV